MTDEEIWKPVLGYEGLYEVSNMGRIRNANGLIRVPYNDKDGYKRIKLSKDGKRKNFMIHRLVAIAFIPNPNNYPLINHKDEIKYHNQYQNLEWCDKKYNVNYGTGKQRTAMSNGIIVNQFSLGGDFINSYWSIAEASRNTNVDCDSIRYCCIGYKWDSKHQKYYNITQAGGYIWKYA